MKIIYKIENGPVLLEPNVFKDDRGYFFESFSSKEFSKIIGKDIEFVQDNESKSSAFVFRGFHFQKPPYAQAKLVRVVKGSVLDIIVDIRRGSPNYGQTYAAYLSENNHRQFYVPEGFAHGFLSLEDDTVFQYKCNNYYNKESEGGIRLKNFDLQMATTSEKDKLHPFLEDFDTPFEYTGSDSTIDEQ